MAKLLLSFMILLSFLKAETPYIEEVFPEYKGTDWSTLPVYLNQQQVNERYEVILQDINYGLYKQINDIKLLESQLILLTEKGINFPIEYIERIENNLSYMYPKQFENIKLSKVRKSLKQ